MFLAKGYDAACIFVNDHVNSKMIDYLYENKVKALAEQGEPPAEIARFTLETVASAVRRATDAARKRWPGLPVLCSGGAASNRLLRTVMSDAAFAAPQYSTDNAMGAAILAWRSLRQEAEA